jgi:hypothetical protein
VAGCGYLGSIWHVRAHFIAQEEPLKIECQHFLDCIQYGTEPLSCRTHGRELVTIWEASSQPLRHDGAAVQLSKTFGAVAGKASPASTSPHLTAATLLTNGSGCKQHAADAAVQVPFVIAL